MPIVVSCGCGKKFASRPELAGRTLKCPSCGESLVVPQGAEVQAAATDKIAVHCQCGGSFAAKPDLAGRRVKCPACEQPVAIPVPSRSAAAKAPAVAPPEVDGSNSGLLQLLDEIGVEASRTGLRCPSCKSDMAAGAVLCIQCGYHTETGKHLNSKVPSKKKPI